MIMVTVIGLVFSVAIGYFAYTFGQCVSLFTRLDRLINKKVFGVLSVFLYFYLVYINQDSLISALSKPFENL